MEYPFGHHKHQHHGRDDEQQSYPPPRHESHSTNYYPGREGFEEEAYPAPPPRPLHPYENPVPGYPGGEQVAGEFRYPQTHQSQEPHFGRPDRVEPGYQRPPPTSDYDLGYQRPPPPSDYDLGYQRPPPPSDFGFQSSYPEPRPAYSSVQHVAHEVNQNPSEFRPQEGHHGRHNPFTSFFHHQSQGASESAQMRTVRVFCQAEENYSLTIRDGKVILARADPRDEFQHWIKDEKYSTKVKDEEGFPSFALVNKATGQALKHSIGATHPVQLCPYIPDVLDESILWTESRDTGEGFRAVRMVNNIRLNLDAFNGDKNHGGVRDGTILVLWEWKKGGNQKWKIVPYWQL